MAYEQRDNSGSLFRNDKGDNPKRPDYTGNAMVDGQMKRMSAWLKDGAKGKFLSVVFDEPKQKDAKPAPKTAPDFDDEMPFAWAFAIPAGLLGWLVYGATLPGV